MTENRQREVTIIDSYPALAQDGAVRARYCAMVSRDPISPRSRRALHGKGRQLPYRASSVATRQCSKAISALLSLLRHFLELRSEICGTVTTVQKDTLVWIENEHE